MMKPTLSWRRRLILGMSIEDARSKFDTPESRAALRLAHERNNQGVYHELILAQRQRNRLPAERRCHIVRHTKPSIKGFQAYINSCPDDYVVREIWHEEDGEKDAIESEGAADNLEAPATVLTLTANSTDSSESGTETMALGAKRRAKCLTGQSDGIPKRERVQQDLNEGAAVIVGNANETSLLKFGTKPVHSAPCHVGRQVVEETDVYMQHRSTVLAELARVAEAIFNDALRQLVHRRESSTFPTTRQSSILDRLIDNVKDAKKKGYTSLSSSSHMLEPLWFSMNLCGKKDKRLLEALRSPLLCFPAEENEVSLSLWVAGSLLERNDFGAEFPYYIAKHVLPESGDDGAPSPNRLPKANIEVYFSPEIYKLQYTIGLDGVLALRRFIGRAIKRQHDPLPTTSSILLSMWQNQQEASGLFTGEVTRIPWLHVIKAKVSAITKTVLDVTCEDAPGVPAMREAVDLVWRTWGHLVKYLHVHGDLDYMHISVHPQLDIEDIKKLRRNLTGDVLASDAVAVVGNSQRTQQGDVSIRSMKDAVDELMGGDNNCLWKGFKPHGSHARVVMLPVDFVVVECLLEKKGLPHRLVVEDMVESLTEMQHQAMEMHRLSIIDERLSVDGNGGNGSGTGALRPVLYAPKITVSHAGVIDAAAHGFQRIRIRGSCIAHVEALSRALSTGEHFVDRRERVLPSDVGVHHNLVMSPPNRSFTTTHHDRSSHATRRHLLGHRVPSSYVLQRTPSGRFRTHQALRPLQEMVADKEERDFWGEHFYRLSDIRLIFHDRVSMMDINNTNEWSSTLKEQILFAVQRRNKPKYKQEETLETAKTWAITNETDEADETNPRIKKTGRKKVKQKRVETLVLEDVIATMSQEKIFEYLCVDMEVRSASHDLRVGDNDGYAYCVKLRRIPQSHLPILKPAMRSLEKNGFINYFGPQRFATYTRHNMHPGLHLLKGEFRAAATIIVQQFFMDADLAAEKRRTGAAISKMYHSKGMGFRLRDLENSHSSRRSIAEHGTALQSVLDSALQATSFLEEDNGESPIEDTKALSLDPCAEAFLRVVGPKVCSMLVHEFLAFVWNDIVNQRLQRYGTFSILPGDLVRTNPLASPHSVDYARVVYASKKDIEKGKYTFLDVVLPVPGVGVQLPENHTTDLYIVTLKRMGILFNPETRQWDIFRPQRCFTSGELGEQKTSSASLYKQFSSSSSFALMEEELGTTANNVEVINDCGIDHVDGVSQVVHTPALRDMSHLRSDLRRGDAPGNPLGVNITGFYRHMLINPALKLKWRVQVGHQSDPHQRWALGMRQAFISGGRNASVDTVDGVNTGENQGQVSLVLGQGLPGRGRGSMQRHHVAPPVPYWLPQKSESCLELSFELPSSVYPSMLLREITKSDVNSSEVIDLDRSLLDTRAKSWHDLTPDQQATYRRHMAKKRQKLFTSSPRAINVALLHQHIFRSGGMRRSLLPSMRSYDNVSK